MALTDEQLAALGLTMPTVDPSAIRQPAYMPKVIADTGPPPSAPATIMSSSNSPSLPAASTQFPQSSLGAKILPDQLIPKSQMSAAYKAGGVSPIDSYEAAMPKLAPEPTAAIGSYDWQKQRGEQIASQRDQMDFKKAHPWGSPESTHPGVMGSILHGLSVAGNIAGDVIAPGTMANIPGTQMHNDIVHANLGKELEQSGAAASKQQDADVKNKAEEATTEHTQAETDALQNPQAKQGITPEEETFHDLVTGNNGQPRVNPDTKKPYTFPEALQFVSQAKPGAKGGQLSSGDVTNYNTGFLDRMKVLNPGMTALPPQYTLPPNATAADFERVDKQLEQVEKAQGTKAQQDQTRQMRQQNVDQSRADKATATAEKKEAAERASFEKNVAPLKADIDFVDNYVASGHYTGSNDDAMLLKYFDLAKPETGFRLTTAEMDRQGKTQSYINSAAAKLHHALFGTWFSDQQRVEMQKSMHDISLAKAQARQESSSPETRAAATSSMTSGGARGGGGEAAKPAQHVAGGKAQGLTEGATGKGSDGQKYMVKGGVWVKQ